MNAPAEDFFAFQVSHYLFGLLVTWYFFLQRGFKYVQIHLFIGRQPQQSENMDGKKSCAHGSGEGVTLVNSKVPFGFNVHIRCFLASGPLLVLFPPQPPTPKPSCTAQTLSALSIQPQMLWNFYEVLICFLWLISFLSPWDFHGILSSTPFDFVCLSYKGLWRASSVPAIDTVLHWLQWWTRQTWSLSPGGSWLYGDKGHGVLVRERQRDTGGNLSGDLT